MPLQCRYRHSINQHSQLPEMGEINGKGVGQTVNRQQFALGAAWMRGNQLLAEINIHQAALDRNSMQSYLSGQNCSKLHLGDLQSEP